MLMITCICSLLSNLVDRFQSKCILGPTLLKVHGSLIESLFMYFLLKLLILLYLFFSISIKFEGDLI